MKSKNIGIKVKAPKKSCNDAKCPFHGKTKVRGRVFSGKVVSKDLNNSATVEWSRRFNIPKYERKGTRKTRIRVHNPECIDADINDSVKIAETKPLSKTKHFIIIEKIKPKEAAK